MISTLRTLFVHNDWARDQLLGLADPLDDAQLDRPFQMGPGSLRNTLRHLWAAERNWLDRWLEKPPRDLSDPEGAPPMPELRERFRNAASERNELLDRLGRDGESQRITFTNREGKTHNFPLGDMMLHVCNHGSHHRAHALNMLRHVGAKVPMLDFLYMKVTQTGDDAFVRTAIGVRRRLDRHRSDQAGDGDGQTRLRDHMHDRRFDAPAL